MTTFFLIILFGVLVIVPCWKAVIAGLLLENDPEKWQKWEEKESERRKKRDEVIGKAVKGWMRRADWAANKMKGGNNVGPHE